MSAYEVVIVGAGPTGLSAATELGRLGIGPVLVVDREPEAGGIPRHSAHQGFGLRDLHRSLSGPRYAEILHDRARRSGAEIELSTTVTDLSFNGDPRLEVTAPSGRRELGARAVLLATGARERPRAARLIPGDRGSGVFTTGQLQQWVAAGLPVGRRAVVLGAEHVSYSAVLTLRHAGVRTIGLITEFERAQSVRGAAGVMRTLFGAPTMSNHRVVALHGSPRLEAVEVEDLASGARRMLEADVFVATGDWIPDHDLARRSGLDLDPATLGPRTDARGRTSTTGVLAAGNLVHPVETADRCALRGRAAAHGLSRVLSGAGQQSRVRVHADAPLSWVWPNLLEPGAPPERLVLRTASFLRGAKVRATQNGRTLGAARLHGGVPNQHSWLPGSLLAGAVPEGPVHLSVEASS
jgi:thioredoxin reductase